MRREEERRSGGKTVPLVRPRRTSKVAVPLVPASLVRWALRRIDMQYLIATEHPNGEARRRQCGSAEFGVELLCRLELLGGSP
jgi:hypothetical protein